MPSSCCARAGTTPARARLPEAFATINLPSWEGWSNSTCALRQRRVARARAGDDGGSEQQRSRAREDQGGEYQRKRAAGACAREERGERDGLEPERESDPAAHQSCLPRVPWRISWSKRIQ